MRSCLLIALVVLVTASCTSGEGDDADSLSQILGPTTTIAPPSTSSTTPTPSTSTTSTTIAVASSTTTIADSTEVLGTGDTPAQTLEELPLTGGELTVAIVALLVLLLGVWLLRQAGRAQTIIDRIRSNLRLT